MRGWLLLLLLAPPGWRREQSPVAVVRFGFERPVSNTSYRFELSENGQGTYRAEYPPTPPATPGERVETPLALHAGTVKKIFEQARSTVVFHGVCETRAKNIAQTGMKTLTLLEATGASSTCTWNYSDKPAVTALQDEFVAMAETLDTGRRLRMEQRFDRLGLDREMGFLAEQVTAGRAQGLENIAPVLESIADDMSLLERVRARAMALLQMSAVER